MPDTREMILQKVRKALAGKTPDPHPDIDIHKDFYVRSDESLEIVFAEQLQMVSGKFIHCETESGFLSDIKQLMAERGWICLYCADPKISAKLKSTGIAVNGDLFAAAVAGKETAAVTACEFLISRTGSVMVSSAQLPGRLHACLPDVHIVLAYNTQLIRDPKDAMEGMHKKYKDRLPSMISVITGPSRTADIEKTLVLGAHGPRELHVYLVGL